MQKRNEKNLLLVIPLSGGLFKVKCTQIIKNVVFLRDKEGYTDLLEGCKSWLAEHALPSKAHNCSDIFSMSGIDHENEVKFSDGLSNHNSEIRGLLTMINDGYDGGLECYNIEKIQTSLKKLSTKNMPPNLQADLKSVFSPTTKARPPSTCSEADLKTGGKYFFNGRVTPISCHNTPDRFEARQFSSQFTSLPHVINFSVPTINFLLTIIILS
jgi:hypothetical protein